jgi:hypothetical protein
VGCACGGQGSGLCGRACEWNGGSGAEGALNTTAAIIAVTITITIITITITITITIITIIIIIIIIINIIIIIIAIIPIITYLQASVQVKFAPPPGGGDSVGRWVEGR